MTRFRPCIDLHAGQVKQIVGDTEHGRIRAQTNYISKHPAEYYAKLYRDANLLGAHVIMLGPGNEEAAREALAVWPDHLQVGGGVTDANANTWIECGAEKVIITSFLFPDGRFAPDRLKSVLSSLNDDRNKLVVDLSCRKKGNTWYVAMNKWQTITETEITKATIEMFEPYCSEFLIHAADNEGLQQGIDTELVSKLSQWCTLPVTYAGGARTVEDLDLVKKCSSGKIDLTIGSALDVFGGSGASFEECVKWNTGDSASN